jgi:hypothetical protein
MDKNGFFGEMLEKGQQTVQKTAKSAVSDVANSVAGQIGIGGKTESSPDAQGQAQTQQGQSGGAQKQPQSEAPVVQAASTEDTKQFVKEFYAPSTDLPENLTPEVTAQMQQKAQAEAAQKLANLRHELHKGQYYDPLIEHETKSEKEEDEESAAKRVEKQEKEEEQKKMELEEKKAKDDQDIAKTRAQTKTEANRGVAG